MLAFVGCSDGGGGLNSTSITVFDGSSFEKLQQIAAPPARAVVLVGNGTSMFLVTVSDVADESVALLSPHAGSFSVHSYQAPPARAVVATDVDTDGSDELLVLGSGELAVFKLEGSAGLSIVTTYSAVADRAMVAADIDGDSVPEIVSAGATASGGIVEIRKASGGELLSPQTYGCGLTPSAVAVADFDGDGLADIAVANTLSSSVTVLWGTANEPFQRQDVPTVGGPSGLAAADLDGDGFTDLVVAGANEVAMLHGGAARAFEADPFSLPRRGYPGAVATFGMENGMARLVGTDVESGSIWMMSMATGNAPTVIATGTAPEPIALEIGDLTNDGVPDIIVGSYGVAPTL